MTVFFAFICSLDEGDDPFKDESCWKKANPSLGHTFEESYLREQGDSGPGNAFKREYCQASQLLSVG